VPTHGRVFSSQGLVSRRIIARSIQETFSMAQLNVNGRVLEHNAEADTALLWVLREQLSA
jgi:hypothetical protein